MVRCSVVRKVRVEEGGILDYERLACFHYRVGALGPYSRIWRLVYGRDLAGVIVYKPASMGLELRNVALGGLFSGLDTATKLGLINRNIECISRVIIEPRFRGLGLAQKLIRETMPQVGKPIVESVAMMGRVNPFFEKAGMTAYEGALPVRCVRMREVLLRVGVSDSDMVDPEKVESVVGNLRGDEKRLFDREVSNFLKSYGKSGLLGEGLARTRFILHRTGARPAYYVWVDETAEVG